MRSPRLLPIVVALVGAVLVVGACSAPAASPMPVEPTIAVDADHFIDLELTADLKIKQNGQQVTTIPVQQGETYTFRVDNSAGFDHDFHIGTEADLSSGGHSHAGLQVWSQGVREFQYTFETPGPLAFGCTVSGHYALMKGIFDIQP